MNRPLPALLTELRTIHGEMARQQFHPLCVGHGEIEDAMGCIDQATGFLRVAISAIEHEEQMEAQQDERLLMRELV